MRPALDALRGDTARLFAEANELKAHWAQLEAAQAEDFKVGPNCRWILADSRAALRPGNPAESTPLGDLDAGESARVARALVSRGRDGGGHVLEPVRRSGQDISSPGDHARQVGGRRRRMAGLATGSIKCCCNPSLYIETTCRCLARQSSDEQVFQYVRIHCDAARRPYHFFAIMLCDRSSQLPNPTGREWVGHTSGGLVSTVPCSQRQQGI